MNDQIAISLISAISGVVIAYIVNVAAKKVQKQKEAKQPKDRMEQMFDGYERLIKQKDLEDDRKHRYIKIIESELKLVKEHAAKLGEALTRTNEELLMARQETLDLKEALDAMRAEYSTHKNKEI